MKTLSRRLEAVAQAIPQGAVVCDIGTDHGHLPIFLISSQKAARVIATDLRQKPLANARGNLEKSGVKGVELRLGSGLSVLSPGEADCIVITGMGGEVIAEILREGDPALFVNTVFVFQPTTSAESLRKHLFEAGFATEAETAVEDHGKLYSVITARFAGVPLPYSPHELFIGNLSANTAAGAAYIRKQLARCEDLCDALRALPEKREKFQTYQQIAEALKHEL